MELKKIEELIQECYEISREDGFDWMLNTDLSEVEDELHNVKSLLFGVSRSVWVVQNKTSKVAHCVFDTEIKASECIDGLKNFEIIEFSLA